MPNIEALLEAERRGILPERKKAALDEARRRGLVPETFLDVTKTQTDQGMYAAGKLGIGSPDTVDPRVVSAASEGLQSGSTLGFSDEIQATLGALGAKLWGGEATEDQTLSELRRLGLDIARKKQEGLREDFPVMSAVSELAGGLATGGAAMNAAKVPLAKAGLGKAAQVVGADVAIGGAAGIGYGEQENPAEYISDFVKGGAISAGTGAVLSGAIKGGGWIGNYIADAAKTARATKDVKTLTKAEAFVTDLLNKRGISKDSLLQKANDLQASNNGQTVPLSVLADDQMVKGISEGIAAMGAEGKAAAVKSIEHLEGLVSNQEKKLLSTISANAGSPHELAGSFKAGVDALAEKLTAGRREAARAAYDAVVLPENVIPAKEMDGLLKFKRADGTYNTAIDDSIKRVRSNRLLSFSAPKPKESSIILPDDFPLTPKENSIPYNSITTLDAAYKDIGARIRDIDKGTIEGGSFDKSLLVEARERLGEAIKKNYPQYGDALDAYAEPSQLINKMFGEKKRKTILGRVLNMTNEDPVKAARMLFDLQPEEIAKTKQIFAKAGMPAQFDDATKAHVMDALERKINPSVQKEMRTVVEKRRLNAALGPERAKAVESVLELAGMLKEARSLTANSPTEFRRGVKEDLSSFMETKTAKAVNLIPSLLRAKFGITDPSTIRMIGKRFQDQQSLTELTNILFDPKESAKFLANTNPKEAKNAPILKLFEKVDRRIMEKIRNATTKEEAQRLRDSIVFTSAGDRPEEDNQ